MNYKLIDSIPEDGDWVNELTVRTMKPWVEASWENESERQQYYELNRFDIGTTKIIVVEGKRAGRISSFIERDTFTLADLHLDTDFHGSGLGTKIITDTIKQAQEQGLAVELKCLKTNPVQNLYIRLGFNLIQEDDKRLYYRIEV